MEMAHTGTRRGGLWPMAVAALALVVAGLYPLDNPDTFGHLAAGRQIAELGHVPSHDTFSFFHPEPQPWVNYEWLSAVVFFSVYTLGGYGALAWLKSALLALLAVVLVRRAQERAGLQAALLTMILLVLATAAARYRFSVRPQLFGMLLSGVYLLGLTRLSEARERATSRPWLTVAALGVLHVLWVNLHGSHLLGLLMTGTFCVFGARQPHARKPLLALLGLQLMASCVSPYGPRIVLDALAHVADPAYRELVEEWQAWTPGKPPWLLCAVILQCVGMLLVLRKLPGDALRPVTLALFALLALMALRSLRFVPDFLLLTSPLLAEGLTNALRTLSARAQRVTLASGLAAALVAAPVLASTIPPGTALGGGVDSSHSPAAISGYLERRAPGARVLAAMEDAWYLMFSAPSARFLIDGRTPFYGPEHLRTVIAAWSSPGAFRDMLDRFGVDAVVLQHAVGTHQTALRALEAMPDFHAVLIEDHHVLFLRDTPARAPWLEALTLRALAPHYDAGFVLDGHAAEPALRAELGRLPDHPNLRAYKAFVRGLLALRPLAREHGLAGFSASRDAASRAHAAAALSSLRDAVDEHVVRVYHALSAVLACRLDEADDALASIPKDQQTRETLLVAQEIALRRGDTEQVRSFVGQARAVPELAGDRWIAELSQAVEAPPACR